MYPNCSKMFESKKHGLMKLVCEMNGPCTVGDTVFRNITIICKVNVFFIIFFELLISTSVL